MSRAKRFDRALQHMEEQLRAEEPHEVRWDEMERKLLARVAQEASPEEQPDSVPRLPQGHLRLGTRALASWRTVALIAAAAAVVLGVALPALRPSSPVTEAPGAGTARAPGAHAAGDPRAPHEIDLTTLHPGDVIDASDAPRVLTHPGVVRWTLAPGGRARIREASGSPARYLVALDRGTLRAEVTPRPPSATPTEIFAVDVERARVTVRGTVFTVTRIEGRMEVQVERGVVAVGPAAPPSASPAAPPSASPAAPPSAPPNTEPHLLIAPARGAFSFEGLPLPDAPQGATHDDLHPPAPEPAPIIAPIVIRASEPLPSPEAPVPLQVERSSAPRASATSAPGAHDTAFPSPTAPEAPLASRPLLTAQSAQAILTPCFVALSNPAPSLVRTAIRATLHLSLRADGTVASIRTDPPLKPELQVCVQSLYAGRFSGGPGAMTIPLAIDL
ncbi:FecR family protein [Chondromyces apiculatus]|uniref:FecR protein domain-containing protein n=1 Tax=Chondromyces apiculatus DSM 436 TaxID=1192034 RepID=A0A017TIH6_9BACT|nr:FecR family protein [Chondromyces apiculatus]EYF08650.1 Hypothetical protein CAP_2510 [Chondromyces apiculatus DSM 436]